MGAVKKRELDHLLRAAGRITGEKQLIVIGSQALHATAPDVADEILRSMEADLLASDNVASTEWLNVIGQDSPFHEQFGYYADPVEEGTAILPKGWKQRLVPLPQGDTEGVEGLCLSPHDLVISKYVARRDKDLTFNRELIRRGLVQQPRLLELLAKTPVSKSIRERLAADIERDFSAAQSALP
jgi:hypothetical protein